MAGPRVGVVRSLIAGVSIVCSIAAASAQQAVQINPENSKYLLFRGKPLALISASEHYGSVVNRPFDFEKYLDDAAARHITVTRTFLLYRELQSARNPSSPIKPESPDFIAPWIRKGPAKALDGEPVYDLDTWNPEYFDRLHRYLDAASKRGIVVELTVFSNTYAEGVWALNPLRAENNLQHIGKVEWEDYISLKDPEIVRMQTAFARKVIDETSSYDNIYYEICNEPGGGIAGHSTAADVDAWQTQMAAVLRDEMKRLNRPHLLSGQQAFTYSSHNEFPQDGSFSSSNFDIVNNHPLPNTQIGNKTFDMGDFMSKQLRLADVAGFCQATAGQRKPVALDEDNTASMYRDLDGWTIHRKRAWAALLSGCHYDYIDFSITVGNETGTAASRAAIRTWMGYLSTFMNSFDYVHAHVQPDWIGQHPRNLVVAGLAVPSKDYVAYLGDARELDDPAAGSPIEGAVSLNLPVGNYLVSLYSPVAGQASPGIAVKGGAPTSLTLPRFTQDIVIRATRQGK